MPSFTSIDGKCYAAKEKAVDIRTGEIYEGPDREAIAFIAKENGISIEEAIKTNAFIGMAASEDPEMVEVAKKHNFNTVEEYLKARKPSATDQKKIDLARNKVVTHQPDKPKQGILEETKGGFFDEKSDPVKEFNKKS